MPRPCLRFWRTCVQDDSAEYRKAEHSSQKLLAGLLGNSKSAHGSQKFYGELATQLEIEIWLSHQAASPPLLCTSPNPDARPRFTCILVTRENCPDWVGAGNDAARSQRYRPGCQWGGECHSALATYPYADLPAAHFQFHGIRAVSNIHQLIGYFLKFVGC